MGEGKARKQDPMIPAESPGVAHDPDRSAPVEQTILDRLGNMVDIQPLGPFQIGDRSGNPPDLVIGPGREAEFRDGLAQQGSGRLAHGGQHVEFLAPQAAVEFTLALTLCLDGPGLQHTLSHRRRTGAGSAAGARQFLPRHGRRVDVNIDAIEPRAADPGSVAFGGLLPRLRLTGRAPVSGVHRGYKEEIGGETHRTSGTRDRDEMVF